MKIYGKKEVALHIVVYALMLIGGVAALARGNFGGIAFFLMVGINAQGSLPRYFDPEKYEQHRRRVKFEKEALQKRFGKLMPVIKNGPMVLAVAALLIYVFFSDPIFEWAVVVLIVAAVVLMYVQKRMLEDSLKKTR